MGKKQRCRRGDDPGRDKGVMIFAQRHVQPLVGLAALVGVIYGAMTHFVSAEDFKKKSTEVEQKFAAANADGEKKYGFLRIELRVVALEARKNRIEDELFRLCNDVKRQGTTPQIQRYETELVDVAKRLRDLEARRE